MPSDLHIISVVGGSGRVEGRTVSTTTRKGAFGQCWPSPRVDSSQSLEFESELSRLVTTFPTRLDSNSPSLVTWNRPQLRCRWLVSSFNLFSLLAIYNINEVIDTHLSAV